MAVETHLGWVRLSHQDAGLELVLNATAKASAALPIEAYTFSGRSNVKPDDGIPAWVSRGNDLRLVLALSAGDDHLVSVLREQSLLQSLGELLNGAELFRQLNLRAHLSIHPHNMLGSDSKISLGRIQINIMHDRATIDSNKPYHQLLKFIPLADVRTPAKTRIITLEEVYISIRLANIRQRIRSRISHRNPNNDFEKNDTSATKEELCPERCIKPEDHDMLDGENLGQDIRLRGTSSSAYILDGDRFGDLEMLDSLPSVPIERPVGAPAATQVLLAQRCTQHPPISSHDDAELPTTETSVHSIHAQHLVDAAVRMTLSKKPGKLARGIKHVGGNFPARLSDIAPGLFSPGHLAALSQRAVFIPTISRALTTKISENAVSPSLKAKLAHLAFCNPCSARPQVRRGSAVNDGAASQSIHDVLETRIWRVAQAALQNPADARPLKPITNSHYEKHSFGADGGNMLEPVVTPSCGCESDMLEDGDEDGEMLSDDYDTDILEGYADEAEEILEDDPSES
ncbi:MAG: hypothetical protein M1821_006022 [Bathelium mastoideum]|nr:MAG: hypothetical protein M1821_006022 [Bathelium mastoideum]